MGILEKILNRIRGRKPDLREPDPKPSPASPESWTWPEDREQILHALDSGEDFRVRARAVELLPYPEERERILRIAAEDRDDYVRDFAIEKLHYPEDRALLVSLAETAMP